jgi:hypothetical protein
MGLVTEDTSPENGMLPRGKYGLLLCSKISRTTVIGTHGSKSPFFHVPVILVRSGTQSEGAAY